MEIEADGLAFKHLEHFAILCTHIVFLYSGQIRALPCASEFSFADIATIGLYSYSNAPDNIAQVRFDAFPHFMG